MAGLKDISAVWKNIKEIDLKPIRDMALRPVRIALVGRQGSGRHTLAEQMRTDPARPGAHTQSPVAFPPLDEIASAPAADLIVIIVDATSRDFTREHALEKAWSEAGKNVLVLVNKIDLIGENWAVDARQGWQARQVLYGSANDVVFLQREFVPVVLELLPQEHLALGRQFPLFRLSIAKQIISETCFSNAAYSFSTGLAEIVPVLDIPLNMTDMIVLTKSQAFLAYKLGLLVGFSTSWQDYVSEFGSVIGGGFLWRQLARQLIGLIPAWGIIPKVAVAYSGTYVVGNAILGWYLTGKHLSPQQLRELSVQAFSRGKEYARKLAERFPRPRLGRRRKVVPQLNPGEISPAPGSAALPGLSPGLNGLPGDLASTSQVTHTEIAPRSRARKLPRFHLRKKVQGAKPAETRLCPQCGKVSSGDASFCQYCGHRFDNSQENQ